VARFEDGFFATWRDVTERTAAAEALHQAEHRFRQFFERTPDYVFLVSLDGRLIDANRAALEALGYEHDDLVGKPVEMIYAPESGARMGELFERWSETGPIANLEQVLLTRAGQRRTVLLSASAVRDGSGRPLYFLGVQRDITELREAQADADLELQIRAVLIESLQSVPEGAGVQEAAQAICDQLTTLPFVDTATVQVFLGARDVQNIAQSAPPGYPVPSGTFLPSIRAQVVRTRAAVGPWAEYVSEDPADGWMPGTIASGLKALAFGPIGHGDHVAGVLALGTFDERFARTLVEKMPGIVSFSTTLSALLAKRLHALRLDGDLRARLVSVLATTAFHPVFQPIVQLADDTAVGFEALTRFTDGADPAVRFVEAAAVGLGLKLEAATLDAALTAAATLPPRAWLNVNVSPEFVLEGAMLRGVLSRHHGRRVVLEVTEHEVISDYPAFREAIDRIGPRFELAVDDTGAGFASLRHILELRPAFLKLDRWLIEGLDRDEAHQAMVVGIGHFARSSGCRIIAEGIETTAERDTLRALGGELGQGYRLGRPLPAPTPGAGGAPAGRQSPRPGLRRRVRPMRGRCSGRRSWGRPHTTHGR
ncbi:MAG: EAL domain-containing protein, partial [Candidatus Limnocylindrales bacterium]